MTAILLVHSTVDGHTREICTRLAELLGEYGGRVDVEAVESLDAARLGDYGKVVVGASIRYGKYRPELVAFVKTRADALNARPSAFFSVNLVARKAGRDTPASNPYVDKLLDQTAWRPDEIAVFAGKLDYPRYGWRDRQIIRLIMWLTGGPTDPATVRDFTDWDKVRVFAGRVADLDG